MTEAEATSPFGISVVLPVYISAADPESIRLLRRALESVRDQRFPGACEIILIDDGSPRPIAELAGHLGAAADCVTWRRSPKNGGLVDALNHGLLAARQPWIARLDSDDAWRSGKISMQCEQLANDPDLTISATGMTLMTPTGDALETHIRGGDWYSILRFFVEGGCPFPHGSVVARRDIYTLLGGYPHDPAVRHCEDYALWEIWLRFFKPAMVEAALYDYTIAPHTASSRNRDQQLVATGLINRRFKALDLTERLPLLLPRFAKALGMNLYAAGVLAYRLWHYRLAARMPEEAAILLAAILPDRLVMPAPEAGALMDTGFPSAPAYWVR